MNEFEISFDGGKNYKEVKSADFEFSNMIQAKELRIGNYLLDNDVIRKVVAVFPSDLSNYVYLDDFATKRLMQHVEAVPLTPEILEKCGFEINSRFNDQWKDGDGHGFEIILSGNQFCYKEYLIGTPELKYLHQLQNLYFALTGSELEIKNLHA